jgi:hypothetical protein
LRIKPLFVLLCNLLYAVVEGIGTLFRGWENECFGEIADAVNLLKYKKNILPQKHNTGGEIRDVCKGALDLCSRARLLAQRYLDQRSSAWTAVTMAFDELQALSASASSVVNATTASATVANGYTDRFMQTNLACALELQLLRICAALEDLHSCRLLARLLVKDLLAKHLSICQSMSKVWESLQDVSKGSEWSTQGVEVANLIASECAGLRLYSILNK